MRHNSRRSKSNSNNRGRKGGNARTQVYDSNGPDVRIRGTAHQVCEKYQALAKDAFGSGDWIMAENYRQHAEHYQRIISAASENTQSNAPAKQKEKPVVDGNTNKAEKVEVEDLGLPESMVREAKVADKTLEDA